MLKRKIIKESNFKKIQKIKFVHNNASVHNCFSRNLYIDCNLEVFPCVMERRFKHGNLKNSELSSLINESIQILTKDFIVGCNKCEYRYFCFDCRPDSLGADQFAKPWFCSYDQNIGEWIDSEVFIKSLKTKYKEAIQ